uniref:Uncharacterized protein MANES_13G113200 n=1 Tax=Rhizophora mucronata TaxID=61149 RepID=A0A2P2K2H7_RHIMU
MPGARHFSRIDTLEIKSQLEMKLGHVKAEKYFALLKKFLSHKISKLEFDRLCLGTIGRENVKLQNHFLRSIIRNACISKAPPPRDSKVEGSLSLKVPNEYQRSSLQSLFRDLPQSPCKGRAPNLCDHKFRDRPSPLGPHGKGHSISFKDPVPKNQEQSATELLSLVSRPPGSVEDGEEVDQAAASPSICSRSPVRAPLGIPTNTKGARKVLLNHLASFYHKETCHVSGQLPDTCSLRERLERSLEVQGMNVSLDFASLLNGSLDVYLKRIIKPCLDLACSRSGQKYVGQEHSCSTPVLNGMWPLRNVEKTNVSSAASILDFRVAMELNPSILGQEWPVQLEKVCLRESKE